MSLQSAGNTIYLTAREAERIQKLAKDRITQCNKSKDQAREPREATPSIQQATGASLMADMGGAPDPDMTNAHGGQVPFIVLGQVYPPCIAEDVEELEEMKIAELKMETHHRGKKLVVRRASPVVELTVRSWCMVQDEDGKETERLEMHLHKKRHGEEILESTKRFIIKEPYFTLTEQGEPTLRVDHPSDIVALRDEIPGKIHDAEKVATSCKKKGNAALKEPDLPEAEARYQDGMKIALAHSKTDVTRDIARNLAYVQLLLGEFDFAIPTAKASLINGDDDRSKELDSKAYFRAGRAAYNLGNYEQAKVFFEAQQKLTPNDKDGRVFLKGIGVRLREQDSGTHDFGKIKLGLSHARPSVDAATYIGRNTDVKNSSGKGRGLYAARDLAAGELIMCEKAFCVVWDHEPTVMTAMTYDVRDERIRVSPVGLSKAILQKLLSNPSQVEKFMNLYGDYQGVEQDRNMFTTKDGKAVVDVFRVQDIVLRNAFGLGNPFGEAGARSASTGIWLYASYINHSCIPNTKIAYIGDLMMLRATRAITAGEELFHAYDASSDYDTRQAALMNTWGFQCACPLCEAEKADDPSVRAKREELRGEADAFVEKEHWAGAKRVAIAKAQRLAKGIDESYDEERFKGLPKLAGRSVFDWLDKAVPRR